MSRTIRTTGLAALLGLAGCFDSAPEIGSRDPLPPPSVPVAGSPGPNSIGANSTGPNSIGANSTVPAAALDAAPGDDALLTTSPEALTAPTEDPLLASGNPSLVAPEEDPLASVSKSGGTTRRGAASAATTPAQEEKPPPPAPRLVRGYWDLTFDHLKFDMEKGEPFERDMLTPEIEDLLGKKIRIRGYINPFGIFTQTNIQRFVFVRDNMECCFGPGAALYDCIVVDMVPPKTTDFTIRPITVEGTLTLEVMEDPIDGSTLAIYHLDGVSAR